MSETFYLDQIDYTSRDFTSIRNDMIDQIKYRLPTWTSRDVSDFGIVLIELFAYMGDILNYYIDRSANESFLDTATRRENVDAIARMLDYKSTDQLPAIATLRFTNPGTTAVVIPADTQVASTVIVDADVLQVVFETDTAVTVPGTILQVSNKQQVTTTATITTALPHGFVAGSTTVTVAGVGAPFDGTFLILATPTATTFTYTVSSGTVASTAATGTAVASPVAYGTVTVSATQGKTVTGEVIAQSSGTSNQNYPLYRFPVLDASPVAYCNGLTYSYVEHLLDYGPYDPVFTTYTNADEITYLLFGDGLHGRIPPFGAAITADYRTGDGASGNLSAGTLTYIISPSSVVSAGLSVTNPAASAGGTDREGIESIRVNAPRGFYALNRAVTTKDYALMALRTPGVSKASASAAVYSSVNIYVAPSSGYAGIPISNALRTSIQTYMADKIQVGTTLTIADPTIIDMYTTLDVLALPQYKRSVVRTSVINKLVDMFQYQNVELGTSVSLMYVLASLDAVPGVLSCNITALYRNASYNVAAVSSLSNQLDFATSEIPRLSLASITATANTGYGLPDV